MSNATEDLQADLQAAADRGELGARAREAVRKQQDGAERRWIIAQAIEVAKASPMSPDDFRQLVNFILEFIRSEPEQKMPGTQP